MKKTGKQIAADLEAAGINALWVPKKGMIFMSAYYGTDCVVQGTYDVYSRDTAEMILAAKTTDADFRLDEYLQGRETGRKYRVR